MKEGDSMMPWGYGNTMSWGGAGSLGLLLWLVVVIDLILVGVWLWKKIQEK